MRELAFLRETLPRAEKPGLEAHDPQYLEITSLGQKGEYEAAAAAVAQLLEQKIYDVRVLTYYFFQTFLEDGPARIGELLETICALVEKNLEALGPAEKREIHLNKSLVWLFQTIVDALEYRRQKNDELWQRWMKAGSPEVFATAAARAQELNTALPGEVYQKTGEVLARVARWMRDLRDSFTALASEAKPEAKDAKNNGAAPAQEARASSVPSLSLPGQMVELRGSPEFVALCNKLKAFELLVERKDFAKAAMVGDDILNLVNSFDPRKYFPDLFAVFGALLHAHVGEIKPYWQQKDSVDWRMAEQFYQVDLESFVRGK